MDAHPIPIERLLAHREWVRGVARAVVGDPNAADDVEQETWLAALSSPPCDEPTVRGWFRVVLRNRARRAGRTESRRGRRESVAARPEATPSTDELAEIADTHRRVVQAVVELDEPYRGTILLRYFEGLAVEDVAARTSVPIDTARSRISRGLAKLRERLTREFGTDDRPWALALAPLIASPKETACGAGIGAAATGGAVMATKTAWALASVFVVGGVAALVATRWNASAGESAVVAAAPAPLPAPAAAQDDGGKAKPPAPTPAPSADEEKSAPAPTKPAATAKERLDAAKISGTWQGVSLFELLGDISAKADVDFVVAAEVKERLDSSGGPVSLSMDGVQGTTLVRMVASLTGVEIAFEDARVVVVPAGGKRDASRATIAVPRSNLDPNGPKTLTVKGVVVDEAGVPVAHAAVIAEADDRSRKPLAESDDAGAFAVEVTRPYPAVFASVATRLPSFEYAVKGKYGDTVELRLALGGPAAVVEGRVTDADGREAPDVAVSIWNADAARAAVSTEPLPPGVAQRRHPSNPTLRTDKEGRFRDDAVPPGRVEIKVFVQQEVQRGKGRGKAGGVAASQTIEAKPSETVHVDLRIPKALAWRGTLRDAAGAPIAGAQIDAAPFGSAKTADDGSFVVVGVRPGESSVLLVLPDGRSLRRRVTMLEGEDLAWDPVVAPAMRVAGRVVDADGDGVRCQVSLMPTATWAWRAMLPPQATKADGSFSFDGLEAMPRRVVVTMNNSLPIATSAEIASSKEDLVLVAAPTKARIVGRIVGADGKPAKETKLVVESPDGAASSDLLVAADGSFSFGPAPAGKWLVGVRAADVTYVVGPRDVGTDDVDLGTVTLPPTGRARLKWTTRGDVGAGDVCVSASPLDADGRRRFGSSRTTKGVPGATSSWALAPGRYVLQVTGPEIQGLEREVEVRAGVDADVDLLVVPAATRRLALKFPGVAPALGGLRVTDDAGGFVHAADLVGGDAVVPLAPGRFRVEVASASSTTLHGVIEVPAENAPAKIDVVLR